MPTLPSNPQESRRIHRDGRIVIIPPEGRGTIWRGSAKPESSAERIAAAAVNSAPSNESSR